MVVSAPIRAAAWRRMIFKRAPGLFAFVSARFDQRPERFGIEHDDGPVLEANPVAGRPNPQLLVDALPRHPDHLADFLLGNGDGPASGRGLVLVGQTNERAGEPPWQVLENDLLNLVTGPPQPRAEQLDELHGQ